MDVFWPVASATVCALDIIHLIPSKQAPLFATIYCLGGLSLLSKDARRLFFMTSTASVGTFCLLAHRQVGWNRALMGVLAMFAIGLLAQ